MNQKCSNCDGTGMIECKGCKGKKTTAEETCKYCNGFGYITCPICVGKGVV